MTSVSIDNSRCENCGVCMDICPRNVFEPRQTAEERKIIAVGEEDACLACMACLSACPLDCITISELSSGRLI